MSLALLKDIPEHYSVPEDIHNKFFPEFRAAYIDKLVSNAKGESQIKAAKARGAREAHNAFEVIYRDRKDVADFELKVKQASKPAAKKESFEKRDKRQGDE